MHTVGVDLGGTNIDCTDAKGVFSGSVDLGGVFVAELIDGCISALAVGIASAVNLFGLEGVVPCGGMGDKLGEQFCALSLDAPTGRVTASRCRG